MGALGYKKARGARRPRRCWDGEDLQALVDYGYYLSLGYSSKDSKDYAYRRSNSQTN
jgi:hypothetical protein